MTRFLIFFVLCVCMVSACIGIHRDKKVTGDAIYADYRIWGDEEGGNVSVKLQYTLGDADGPAVLLPSPAHVTFDGELLEPDSSRYDGRYYELLRPAEDFAGKHTIVLTDVAGKVYTTEFYFPVIILKTELPAVVRRGDLSLELTGLQTSDRIRVFLVDTSFTGRGLERMDTVKNGGITISRAELADLYNGPINMSLNREEEKRLPNAAPAGGRLYLSYGLKREFELQSF